ncbi:uncharacterized protein LOC122304964 [Carya illinoinensis]|uniref:uncharacterized protein LOC122304964 n=1 Tax=Carya illinoinensis TaxID=32201 RepID=UPI001C729210|nr:uncharacterized protein LOC122304964 [Carya illinoinensis]
MADGFVEKHFDNLLSKPVCLRPKLDGLSFESLDPQSESGLEWVFEEDKVFKVIRSMAKDKAPGPDGFSMCFFHDCWDVVKCDIMQVFAEFHSFHKFEKNLDAMFIALIPNKHGAKVVEDFHPISLVSGVYKIISKVLGRQILDLVLIANEYLDNRMQESVLVNGTPAGFFNSSRGLRQGNSLSPFLFVIVMEAFSRLVKAVVGRFFIRFSGLSGLKVNLGKFEMVAVGAVPNINSLARLLDCKVSSLPMIYLDLLLGATFKAPAIWDGVVEKVEKKLSRWKWMLLYSVGNTTAQEDRLQWKANGSKKMYSHDILQDLVNPRPCLILMEEDLEITGAYQGSFLRLDCHS